MLKLKVFSHPDYSFPLPGGHRFPMEKFELLRQSLLQDKAFEVAAPEAIEKEDAELVHSADYVTRFIEGKLDSKEIRKAGLPWSEQLVRRTFLECGGTFNAALEALESGYSGNAAGGTHHAYPDYASGFCLLNDLSITAAKLINKKIVEKILILDLDVHQGDGTAKIFENNHYVKTVSMHCKENFPAQKQESDLDLTISKGFGDEQILEVLYTTLPNLLKDYNPDLVLYDAGIDVLEQDELGLLEMTIDGLFNRDKYIFELCKGNNIPVASVIGGGYQKSLDNLSQCHTVVFEAAKFVFGGNFYS